MLTAIYYLLGLIIIGGVIYILFAVTLGKGEPLPEADHGYSHTSLPARSPITRVDVDNLAFNITLRGYSQQQVDWVLDRLIDEIEQLHSVINSLQVNGDKSGSVTDSSDSESAVLSGDAKSNGAQ